MTPLEQARQLVLRGCGLPQAWAALPQWRILDTRFGSGLNFLATWEAWKRDPNRPRHLHYLAVDGAPLTAPELLGEASPFPELAPLASELAAQWFGLLPGAHRLVFEQGRVLLTLHVRDLNQVVRRQPFTADSVFLGGRAPDGQPLDAHTLKAMARHCRRGAGVAGRVSGSEDRGLLARAGFSLESTAEEGPPGAVVTGTFSPAWQPKNKTPSAAPGVGRCVVVGSGLAGAAAACSLARRGWSVTVLDAAGVPAAGASGLPVGLLAPHHSPDDNLLSRLSRAGVRATLHQAQALLQEGEDWRPCGALEHRVGLGAHAQDIAQADVWSRAARDSDKRRALLDPTAPALWHEKAAWIQPAALVRAWLATPGIEWRGHTRVGRCTAIGSQWLLHDAGGVEVARADLVVLATALATAQLSPVDLGLHAVRGQIAWAEQAPDLSMPPFAVNGNGHFIPGVPVASGLAWFCGSTYGPGDNGSDLRAEDHEANLARLHTLLPAVAHQLAPAFASGQVHGWAGVRCASSHRRPLLGQLHPGLWAATAMGSRGLTFAHLCAEILAARIHHEPLPVDLKLAQALEPGRPPVAAASSTAVSIG